MQAADTRGADAVRYENHIKSFPPAGAGSRIASVEDDRAVDLNTHSTPYPVEEAAEALENMNIAGDSSSSSSGDVNVQGDANSSGKSQTNRRKVPDLASYSPVALQFYKVYQATVADAAQFTCPVQLRWCKTLLEVSQDHAFVNSYTINGEKLKRTLNPDEVKRNQRIILEHAIKVLTKLIRLKYADAYYLMGSLYSHRVTMITLNSLDFIDKNDYKALEYYMKGSDLGQSECSYRAGISFEYMKGTPESMTRREAVRKAIKYYEIGAKRWNNANCMYRLGSIFVEARADRTVRNVAIGIEWYMRASEAGSSHACFEMGKLYEFDNLGPDLQVELGHDFKDDARALAYYFKCAHDNDYSLAQWRIGHCYEFGELGLPVDAKKSIAWYYKSANDNTNDDDDNTTNSNINTNSNTNTQEKKTVNVMGMLGIAGWYLTGIPDLLQQDLKESYRWLIRCDEVSQGKSARVDYILGCYYQQGIGCSMDPTRAQFHFERAAKHGYSKAADMLAR